MIWMVVSLFQLALMHLKDLFVVQSLKGTEFLGPERDLQRNKSTCIKT